MACYGDSETRRHIDRVRAITFREARDAGASFVTKSWVAERLSRSERFVQANWNRDPYDCAMDTEIIGIGGRTVSIESQDIIARESCRQKKSVRVITKILEEERGKPKSKSAVHLEIRRMGFKPFHVVKKPMKSELSLENRLWFCDFLSKWDEESFLHLAPSDEVRLDFFSTNEYPANSPDLNATENLGAILKERVEKTLITYGNDVSLRTVLESELEKLKDDTELFRTLLRSYPARLKAVREAKGGHTNY